MYFDQGKPMYWPGTDSKVTADADAKAVSDGPHIVFDGITGFEGSYPGASIVASGKPQASGIVDASAPFDSHADFTHGDFNKGDFVPGYTVVGDHATADAAADAQAQGFGHGMFFDQGKPMYWPGTDSKVTADADAKAVSDGPHIVFDAVTGFDGSYPDAVLSSSGKAMASGDVDAHAPFDSHVDFAHGDSGKGGFGNAYVVGGDHVSADAAADAHTTGFGDGMYFGKPTPMFWPGADSKVGADAGAKAISDGPHIVFDGVPG